MRARPITLDRFLEVAARQADSLAIDGVESVSFGALRRRVEGLGGALRQAGVGPGVVVGLSLPPSTDHIAAMLAVWWAGGAFLPLDLAWPAARTAFACEDAGLRFAISRHPLGQLRVLHPEDSAPGSPFEGELHDSLAYVIYTSGSTGLPKGVRVAHRGLLPVLEAQIEAFRLAPGKRALLFLSTAFDASISDIGTALLSGATLCLPPRPASPAQLAVWIERARVTHADLPPSLLPLLGEPPASLEVVVIGGEVCPPEVVCAWARRLRIVNVYGPTEATICTSMIACDPASWSRPLLGDPLPHVRYRVVADSAGSGELWIGGEALALGYIHQPAFDQAKFVHDGPDRWYRTGDRVQAHPDGSIEFLGRIDRQRKIRGQLVAPEEVEACLRAFPGVQDAAVVVRELARPGRPPREALVAFVVASTLADRAPLAAHLRGHLPRFLCPAVILVESLPRGTTGKTDHTALTTQSLPSLPLRSALFSDLSAPDYPSLLSALTTLFADLLGLPEVGADEDFFALGGDSFVAIEIVAAAAAIGLDLPADALHEAPTPRALAGLAASAPGRPASELREEVAKILAKAASAPPRHGGASRPRGELLLTGATGFLGSKLLGELIARGRSVACLVRARDEEEGRQRLAQALAQHGDRRPLDARIRVVPGDIEAPRFGLDEGEYGRLCARIETVVHSAAAVNHTLPCRALWGPNVQGTAETLAFVQRACPGQLYLVSTLSVLVATDRTEASFSEESDPERATFILGGYAQSKWAAERLVREQTPFACVRPGLLTGDSLTGRSAPAASSPGLSRGSRRSGAFRRVHTSNFASTSRPWISRPAPSRRSWRATRHPGFSTSRAAAEPRSRTCSRRSPPRAAPVRS